MRQLSFHKFPVEVPDLILVPKSNAHLLVQVVPLRDNRSLLTISCIPLPP